MKHQVQATPKVTTFDFDDWAELARRNPEAFEARRAAEIEKAIASAPAADQQRLRGLQWRIDQVRNHAGTPLAACIRISKMMWETALGENGLLDALDALDHLEKGNLPMPVPAPARGAQILAFPGPRA